MPANRFPHLSRTARRCVLAAAVATSLMAASCADDDSPTVETADDTTTTTSSTVPSTTSSPTTAPTTDSTSASGPEAGQRVRIAIKDFAFNPNAITVKPGVVISWVNEDATDHTITADDGAFDYRLPRGKGVGRTFTSTGNFAYHCKIHTTMTGTITVS